MTSREVYVVIRCNDSLPPKVWMSRLFLRRRTGLPDVHFRNRMSKDLASKMGAKRNSKATLFPEAKSIASPAVPLAAVLSFLKDTRGITTWTARLMTEILRIAPKEAKQALVILELQGYVKPSGKNEWMTTIAGESVSGSKEPRYTPKRIEDSLAAIRDHIKEVNRDAKSPLRITQAVAFGDFLGDRTRVQAADVGIELVRRMHGGKAPESATEYRAREEFLRERLGKTAVLHLRPFENWMRARTHRNLLN